MRFAGPRLENGGDELLPVPLRVGGRALGGALSWSTPQPLAPFEDTSLFAGLTVPQEVTVNRQVLADPALLGPDVQVWARLQDGTPLVTARKLGEGQIILFHVTANSDWSNLPLSGLFVEMLRRISALGTGVADGGEASAPPSKAATAPEQPAVLPPLQTLDGFGILQQPPPTAQPVPSAKVHDLVPSLDHPPGYYGTGASPRAVNVLGPKSTLAPLPPLPAGAERLSYAERRRQADEVVAAARRTRPAVRRHHRRHPPAARLRLGPRGTARTRDQRAPAAAAIAAGSSSALPRSLQRHRRSTRSRLRRRSCNSPRASERAR